MNYKESSRATLKICHWEIYQIGKILKMNTDFSSLKYFFYCLKDIYWSKRGKSPIMQGIYKSITLTWANWNITYEIAINFLERRGRWEFAKRCNVIETRSYQNAHRKTNTKNNFFLKKGRIKIRTQETKSNSNTQRILNITNAFNSMV